MKSMKVTDIGAIKNELNKYRKGKKLDINQFNQVARLAWLGKVTMQPLDPHDENVKSWLVFVDYPDDLPGHFLRVDEDLVGHIHIVDSEQGEALGKVVEQGVRERAGLYRELSQRDFYFGHFYKPGEDK